VIGVRSASMTLAATVATAAMVACSPAPPPPPREFPDVAVATATPGSIIAVDPALGDEAAFERHVREITYRIRKLGCGEIGVGSAVAVGPRLLATNRHVIERARTLEIAAWDGSAIMVTTSETVKDQDLGLVRVNQDLPAIAESAPDPLPGEDVYAVGYPGGGQFQRTAGKVVDYVDGTVFEENSRIMRVTVPLRHGNSGGALLNRDGDLVGVVFALERATGYGLVIPASALQSTIASARFQASSGAC